MRKNKTVMLAKCGVTVALTVMLSYIPLFSMPMGGSVTLCSMAPIILLSFWYGWRWAVPTGVATGLIQMLFGIKYVMLCKTIWAMLGCVLLDYVVAFAVIGTGFILTKYFKNRTVGIIVGTFTAGLLRYFCSFLSGVLIWGGYAPEGTPIWLYSLLYNGSYMIPEIILTTIAVVIIIKKLNFKNI